MPFSESGFPFPGGSDTVVIASGASLSAEIALGGRAPVAILMPSAWTAANLTFAAALASGGTFVDVYDDAGTEYLVTAAASRWILLSPAAFVSFAYLKVRSGTAGAAVAQGAARTLTLLLREV